jgi:hypothetical protein
MGPRTDNLSDRMSVRDGLSQLAEPQGQPTAFGMAAISRWYQVLSWIGIVGGAITLFTHFRDMVELSAWAHMLIVAWRGWSTVFWQFGAGWLGIRLPPEYAILFSFASFSLMTAIGARRHQQPVGRTSEFYWTIFSYWMLSLFSYGIVFMTGAAFGTWRPALAAVVGLIFVLPSFFVIHLFRRQPRLILTFAAIFLGFSVILLFKPTAQTLNLLAAGKAPGPNSNVSFLGLALGVYILQFAMLAIAPLSALVRRVLLLATGLALLLGLNQLLLHASAIEMFLSL